MNPVTDLLAARTRKQQPALTFETDLEALLFAAACVDELSETARTGELAPEVTALKLDQTAAVIRACIRLHPANAEETR